MEIGVPTFQAKEQSYSFKINKCSYSASENLYYELNTTELNPPASVAFLGSLFTEFIQGTHKWFSVPLVLEKVLKRLRHEVNKVAELPEQSGWYTATFIPSTIIIKPTEITLQWTISEFKASSPQIPSNFLASTTPRPGSPEQTTSEVRTIQVHDSLIPVGDIPLSDLPPLNFSVIETNEGDPEKEENKRRLREAKLRVALAKLKAQRMEQKYFERYGEQLEESESSDSEFSDSENEAFARYSHS